MSEQIFEERLTAALARYTDRVAEPFDPDEIVERVYAADRPRQRYGLLVAPLVAVLLLLILSAAIAIFASPQPAPSVEDWSGALRREPGGALVAVPWTLTRDPDGRLSSRIWSDPPRSGVPGWLDIAEVIAQPGSDLSLIISFRLESDFPRDPGIAQPWTAYGLVLETTGDDEIDYRLGIERRPNGRYRLWLTDLATGETRSGQYGGDVATGHRLGDGFPFGDAVHPAEWEDEQGSGQAVWFTLEPFRLGIDDQSPHDVRFYAWTAARDAHGRVAVEFTPSSGWLSVPASGR